MALAPNEVELIKDMRTSMVVTSSDPGSLPSTMMQPLETTDDWLFSFMNLEFDSEGDESNKAGPLPPVENLHEMIPAKQTHPMSSESLYIPNYLTVMMSAEQTSHNEGENKSDEEEMSVDETEDATVLSQPDITSNCSIGGNRRFVYTQDSEKQGLGFPRPSMTEIPTTTESSPESKASPSIRSLQTSAGAGTGAYTCSQCPYSCPRKCDLR